MVSKVFAVLAAVGAAMAVPLATTKSDTAVIDTPAAIFSSLAAHNMSSWAAEIAATATATPTASSTLIIADSSTRPEWQVPSNVWSSWIAKQTVQTVPVEERAAAPATTAAPSSNSIISTLDSGSATLIIADSPTVPEWQVPSDAWSSWLAKQTVQTVSTAVAKRAATTTGLIIADSPSVPEWQVPSNIWSSWLAKQTATLST